MEFFGGTPPFHGEERAKETKLPRARPKDRFVGEEKKFLSN
jgi:hypothetical protein